MRLLIIALSLFSASLNAAHADGTAYITTLKPGPIYIWKPKDDITAHELALVVPIILTLSTCRNVLGCDVVPQIEKLPPEAFRHFERQSN